MGGIQPGTSVRSSSRVRRSAAGNPQGGDLESPHHRHGRRCGVIPSARSAAPEGGARHLAAGAGVHPALIHACAAARFQVDSALWLACQPTYGGDAGHLSRLARCGRAATGKRLSYPKNQTFFGQIEAPERNDDSSLPDTDGPGQADASRSRKLKPTVNRARCSWDFGEHCGTPRDGAGRGGSRSAGGYRSSNGIGTMPS